jgi:predicted unusual protein kinase regulating ubiquinone biosynthesis (AarF/ABC1/UbiB family)
VSMCLQVHLATLKSGERVVVKVQRPGLKDLFDIDLKNIRWGTRWTWACAVLPGRTSSLLLVV